MYKIQHLKSKIPSLGMDQRVLVWDLAAASQVIELKGHTSTVYQLAFSRDGSLLASGGMDNCVKLWDAANFEEHSKSINSSKGCVQCLDFKIKGSVFSISKYRTNTLGVNRSRVIRWLLSRVNWST